MAKWLLVDGYNLAYRCFFAIPELTRADGFPTNALHGWVKSLWMLADQTKPATGGLGQFGSITKIGAVA